MTVTFFALVNFWLVLGAVTLIPAWNDQRRWKHGKRFSARVCLPPQYFFKAASISSWRLACETVARNAKTAANNRRKRMFSRVKERKDNGIRKTSGKVGQVNEE